MPPVCAGWEKKPIAGTFCAQNLVLVLELLVSQTSYLDCEFFPALGAAAGQNCPAGARAHSLQKPMDSFAMKLFWMICRLHGYLLSV